MQSVIDFYGDKGDESVSVSILHDSGAGGTENYQPGGGESVSVKLTKPLDAFARNIAHEGQHGADDQIRGREIYSLTEREQTELNAYTTQAVFQKALNFVTSSNDGWTPLGGYNTENIRNQARDSVKRACGTTTTGSCGDQE